jgi:DNA (cytosine-5)-methyltransferase 1
MWPEAIRAVREIRPRAFVLENVLGLFRPAFSAYLEYITLQLAYPDLMFRGEEAWETHLGRLHDLVRSSGGDKTEYRVLARAIKTADYGAPQNRRRAIILGVASKLSAHWSFPAPTHSQEALAWSKHVDFSYWEHHGARRIREPASEAEAKALSRVLASGTKPIERPWVSVRDAISDLPPPTKREKISGHWQHPGARAYPKHTGSGLDEPAKALKAGDHGVPGGENMLSDRKGRVRYFTIREMARLQGFPDEFVVSGTWKAATRQLGNAVPTAVGQSLGSTIMSLLGGTNSAPSKDSSSC